MTSLPVETETDRIDVHLTTSARGCSVTVHGEIDSATAPGLRDCLLETLSRSGPAPVEVDLSRVTRVGASTGCASIVTDAAGRNQIAVGSGANLLGALEIAHEQGADACVATVFCASCRSKSAAPTS